MFHVEAISSGVWDSACEIGHTGVSWTVNGMGQWVWVSVWGECQCTVEDDRAANCRTPWTLRELAVAHSLGKYVRTQVQLK